MDKIINSFNKNKILITGGGGYLGSYLAKKICLYECEVFLLDISFNSISMSINKQYVNVSLIEIDLTDVDSVFKVCESVKPDYIYHFAASLNRDRDFRIYSDSYKINVEILHNLLKALQKKKYKGFYFSSTSELYGHSDNPSFYEGQNISPVSPYSLTKTMAEFLLSSFSKTYNKPYTILRIFNFFGPNQPSSTFIGEMISSYLKEEVFYMSKGEQERDFIFIDELIDQITHISTLQNRGEIYNLCSGKGTSLNEIVKAFKKISDKKFNVVNNLPYRKNEIMKIIGSNQKLLKTGYNPKILNLEKALQKCLIENVDLLNKNKIIKKC